MKSRACRVVALAVLLFGCSWTVSASALDFFLPFKRGVDADPRKSYTLSEEHGPWLVMAASFFGDHGEYQAHQLALELRKDYKLPAYVYKKGFDYGETVIGRGVDRRGRPKQMRYAHASRFEEHAVLVGDFETLNDSKAQKVLETIKHAKPGVLSATEENPTSQLLAGWRHIKRVLSPDAEDKAKGPMGSAFITRNPMLPEDYFVKRGADDFILNLNKDAKHSLLDCPGNYSVRVATFRAFSTWDQREIEKAESGMMKSKLVKGAEDAHELTQALRRQGVEAYEFHDRCESMVTIGSFDSVGERRSDGKIEINPQVHEIMRTYAPKSSPYRPGVLEPKVMGKITFDVQPMPVQVPRTRRHGQVSAMRY